MANKIKKSLDILSQVCPVCKNEVPENFGEHIKKLHGENEFSRAVLNAKGNGMPDLEIGRLFNITFRELERIITEAYGINISVLKNARKIKYWRPKNFEAETTTVWSFKQRGNWATHDGRYRGNWSPYIPRNVIWKYSKPGDVVLDYFVGGGTTAVEAKLLGRRCIARDINPAAIGLTLENLKFTYPETFLGKYPVYEPDVSVGDATDLSDLTDNSIDLICAHPPYAGIINYSSKVEGDLSKLSIEEFLRQMGTVAHNSFRILKPGSKCAILIGDTRKHKHVIPMGFQTLNVFLEAGFKLRELVIKRQHNCKTTGFWYEKSTKYNFLLLAHEYLPIFEKPKVSASLTGREKKADYGTAVPTLVKAPIKRELDELETTTVWIFPEKDFEERLNKNVIERYSQGKGHTIISFVCYSEDEMKFIQEKKQEGKGLLFIKSKFLTSNSSNFHAEFYIDKMKEIINRELPRITKGGFIVIQIQDIRTNGYVEPLAKRVVDCICPDNLWLKEIVVITQEGQNPYNEKPREHLKITHQYLLVYEKTEKD